MRPKAKEGEYWIDAFRNGDDRSLSYFFKLHSKSLGYFAFRLVQDKLEAEDITAECFVKVWERRSDFKTEENIKAFLYISCRNACLDYLRRLKVKSVVQEAYYNQLLSSEETILYHIVKSEVLQALNKEIELLPENYRQVFKLIYFDYKKTDEIALELGISVQTVRNYKSRAVELLKATMLRKGISAAIAIAGLMIITGK
jgi:RNA polymerase sigma-70 factor (family 1)